MFYVWGVILDWDKCILHWHMCFIWGGCLNLELSCTQVNFVYFVHYITYAMLNSHPVNAPGMKEKHDENSFLVCEACQWVIGS